MPIALASCQLCRIDSVQTRRVSSPTHPCPLCCEEANNPRPPTRCRLPFHRLCLEPHPYPCLRLAIYLGRVVPRNIHIHTPISVETCLRSPSARIPGLAVSLVRGPWPCHCHAREREGCLLGVHIERSHPRFPSPTKERRRGQYTGHVLWRAGHPDRQRRVCGVYSGLQQWQACLVERAGCPWPAGNLRSVSA